MGGVIFASSSGCKFNSDQSSPKAESNQNDSASPTFKPDDRRTSGEDRPTVFELDGPGFENWRVERQGSWILVDFWATWCAPCVEKFPQVVELEQKFREKGLIVVSFSMDEPDEVASVQDFLLKRSAEFPALIRAESMGAAFENLGISSLPELHLFRPDGSLEKKFSDEFEWEELTDFLNEVLTGQ